MRSVRKPELVLLLSLAVKVSVYSANSCYFDGVNDEVATVKWPGEKQKDANKTLNCIVTVTAFML